MSAEVSNDLPATYVSDRDIAYSNEDLKRKKWSVRSDAWRGKAISLACQIASMYVRDDIRNTISFVIIRVVTTERFESR